MSTASSIRLNKILNGYINYYLITGVRNLKIAQDDMLITEVFSI